MANNSSDLYLHYFYFQAFSDELDVRQGDFESIRSQGDRLVCQLSDQTEREVLRKQMDDISHRLDRIQNLVNDRGQRIGERTHYGIVEFEIVLKDCYDRIEQFKTNLRGGNNLESIEEKHEGSQVSLNKKKNWSSGLDFGFCCDFRKSLLVSPRPPKYDPKGADASSCE